jgi:hypothetical protein
LSKNIVVQLDGVAENYTVSKIHTTSRDGDNATWIPLDETEQAIKTIVKNGTYKASSDGYYGYSKVIVKVKAGGKTVGTKADGKTYAIGTDEDGWLTETLLPDNIRITTQPTKTSYTDGESIDLAGAVVKAYSLNDLWEGDGYTGGVIPLSELTAEPSTVRSSGGGGGGSFPDLNVLHVGASNDTMYFFGWGVTAAYNNITPIGVYNNQPVFWGVLGDGYSDLYLTKYNGDLYAYSAEANSSQFASLFSTDGSAESYLFAREGRIQVAKEWVTVSNAGDFNSLVPESFVDPTGVDPSTATSEITVKWNRPEDDKELTDSYDISITGGNNGTGNS